MTTYRPFDQRKHLDGPPWHSGPELETWEEAHGHDVRVKCYVEYGCKAIEAELERLRDAVQVHRETVTGFNDTWVTEDGGPSTADIKLWSVLDDEE